MSTRKNASPPSTTIKIICVCVGCKRWESLLVHARLLVIAPNRCDEVDNMFKCKYVYHHDQHAYDAEGKVYTEPNPRNSLNKLVSPPSQKQIDSSPKSNTSVLKEGDVSPSQRRPLNKNSP
jgi:hypothetical protein